METISIFKTVWNWLMAFDAGTWDLQCWCRLTAGSLIPGIYVFLCSRFWGNISLKRYWALPILSHLPNVSSLGTNSKPPDWTSWETPSPSTDATPSWTAPRPAPRYPSSRLYLKMQEFAQNIHVQGLNPGKAIAEIKKLLAGIADKGEPGLKVNSQYWENNPRFLNYIKKLLESS